MPTIKPELRSQSILDAAERLLRQGRAAFSMRDLAAEAGVSFATPFNRFGGKAGIMQALSAARIDRMEALFAAAVPTGNAIGRVDMAATVAAGVMLEEPVVNRAVMGWLGAPTVEPNNVLSRSTRFWRSALGNGEGLPRARRDELPHVLPTRLAICFRGALSFWTAGELPDEQLAPVARDTALALLRGPDDPGP